MLLLASLSLIRYATCPYSEKDIFYIEGGGHNLINLAEVHKVMLHIKYQGSKPCGFRQEEFFMYSYLAYVNHVTPGAGPFLAPGA